MLLQYFALLGGINLKRFFALISVILAIVLFGGCVPHNTVTRNEKTQEETVVVTVGGVDYTLDRFNLYLYNTQDEVLKSLGYDKANEIPQDFWDARLRDETMLDMAKKNALDMLIDDALEYNKAIEYNLKLSADDYADINNLISSLRQDKVSLAQFEYIGISVDELKEYYQMETLMPHLLKELVARGEIEVPEDEVLELFTSNYVKIKHIFFPTVDAITGKEFSKHRVDSAYDRANEVLSKLNAGQDFDELMNMYTEDYNSTNVYHEGYLFTYGDWDSAIEEAAFSLGEGEISGIVTSADGLHIIKRLPMDFEGSEETECIKEIELIFAEPKRSELIKKWREETEIIINEEVLNEIQPTITNNRRPSFNISLDLPKPKKQR